MVSQAQNEVKQSIQNGGKFSKYSKHFMRCYMQVYLTYLYKIYGSVSLMIGAFVKKNDDNFSGMTLVMVMVTTTTKESIENDIKCLVNQRGNVLSEQYSTKLLKGINSVKTYHLKCKMCGNKVFVKGSYKIFTF